MQSATYLREVIEEMDQEQFVCPRCEEVFEEIFFGPCPDCVAQLRHEQVWSEPEGWDWDEWAISRAGKFEPPMHVQPNAVALKD